jgi:hypothetical protein
MCIEVRRCVRYGVVGIRGPRESGSGVPRDASRGTPTFIVVVPATVGTGSGVPVTKTGQPIRTGGAARRAAGVHVPSAHGLRATYITLARAGGTNLEAIADDVGHADIRMTRRYLNRSRRKANNSALCIPVDFGARSD